MDSLSSRSSEAFAATPQWILRLMNNLGVYLFFFAAGYLVLKRVKSRPEPDPSNPSFTARWTRFLFYGASEQHIRPEENGDSEVDKLLTPKATPTKLGSNEKPDETTNKLNKTNTPEESFGYTAMKLIFCVVGLLGTFLSWGLLQERIMTTRYETGFFESSNFTVFCSRTFGWLIAFVITRVTIQPPMKAPFYQFSLTSLSNVMSSYCQLESLKYLSFPTQVLGKSSKMIPVMVMGKILNKKSYPLYEYGVALSIFFGVGFFMISEKSPKGSTDESVNNERTTTIAGIVLLIGYLMFDSFTSQWQDKLFKDYKLSSYQMMLGVNSFSATLTLLSLLQTGEFFSSIDFVLKNGECLYHIILFSISGATGSMFIFYTIKTFGPLVFTMIMVTRQLIAIILSCIFYGHDIEPQGIVGAAVVFIAIAFQIYKKEADKRNEKNIKKIQANEIASNSFKVTPKK